MDERVQRFTAAVEKNPANHLARFSLAKALFDAGSFAKAEPHLRTLLGQQPDWMLVEILLAKCLIHAGNMAEAIRFLQHARDSAVVQHHEGPLSEIDQMLEELRR